LGLQRCRRLVAGCSKDSEKIYPGAPHGLSGMHKDQLNTDLLAFLRS
jgi:non-heme chloroperoxidase